MSLPLVDRLVQRIAEDGPLPFETFMEAALYDPDGGFFASAVLRSEKAGDFLTSPEVSPMFGETIAGLVRSEHERVGDPFSIVEAGAGSGSLLRPLVDAAGPVGGVWAVEVSPAARRRIGESVPEATVVDDLDSIGRTRGIVVANELLDNLPAALVVRTGDAWRERWVGADGPSLLLVDAPVRSEVAEWADRFAGDVPDGGVVEVQLRAAGWLNTAIGMLEAGSVVVIDYGDTAEGLKPRRIDGTIRTYRSHHLGPDPLSEPGATDITMDVNFTALLGLAIEAGADVEYLRQDDFLTEWGLRDRLSELRHDELELASGGEPMERMALRSRRTDAETLLHPRGLGDFRVLIAKI